MYTTSNHVLITNDQPLAQRLLVIICATATICTPPYPHQLSTRTPQTIKIEAAIRENAHSLTSIACQFGVSRQRVHSIKVRFCQQVTQAETPVLYPKGVRDAFLIHKPVNNRRSRPEWAMDEKQLMLRCVGKKHMVRFTVAQMYWRNNMTVKDIACALDTTITRVEAIIKRLVAKGAQ